MNSQDKKQHAFGRQGWFLRYWQMILFVAITLFNTGYTVAKLETFTTKEEVTSRVIEAIQKHKDDSEKLYIKIDQVPGLTESLKSINDKLDDLRKRFDKLEDKIK